MPSLANEFPLKMLPGQVPGTFYPGAIGLHNEAPVACFMPSFAPLLQSWGAHSENDDNGGSFESLAAEWREEAMLFSSPFDKFTHPAYQQIIAFGPSIIPAILRELRERPDDWFYALRLLSRENPADGLDDFSGAVSAWLEWGYRNNYI